MTDYVVHMGSPPFGLDFGQKKAPMARCQGGLKDGVRRANPLSDK